MDSPRDEKGRVKRLKKIQFPEDRLVESYYAKNPDVSFMLDALCHSLGLAWKQHVHAQCHDVDDVFYRQSFTPFS